MKFCKINKIAKYLGVLILITSRILSMESQDHSEEFKTKISKISAEIKNKSKKALQLNNLLGEKGLFTTNDKIDSLLHDILVTTKNRTEFASKIVIKGNLVRLSAWLIILLTDSKNPTGFIAEGINNLLTIESILFETLAEFYNLDQSLGDIVQKIRKGATEKEQLRFLLASCFGVLCDYINVNMSKKSSSEMFSLFKRVYFFKILLEQPKLNNLLTDKKIFHSEKSKNYDYFYTANITETLKNFENDRKTFDNKKDFIEYIKDTLDIATTTDKLELEKDDLFTLIFKMGFLFYTYQNEFKDIRDRVLSESDESNEYKAFVTTFFSHIIKIQNCIESKTVDKDLFRSFFNSVLLVALKNKIFHTTLEFASYDDYESKGKVLSFSQNLQMLLLLIVRKNLLECQRHAHNIKEIIIVGGFGLGTLGLAAGIALAGVFPPSVITSVALAGAIAGALSGSATILTCLTGGKTWDSVKNLLTRSPESSDIRGSKIEFLNFANEFVRKNKELAINEAVINNLTNTTEIFAARDKWYSRATHENISEALTDLSIVEAESENKVLYESEDLGKMQAIISDLQRRIEKLEAAVSKL